MKRAERRASDASPSSGVLPGLILPLLREQSTNLAERWTGQARVALLLEDIDGEVPHGSLNPKGLVDALIDGLADGDEPDEDPIGQGMHFGRAAFTRGVSLHHMLKALDLLMAMTLYAVESALDHVVLETNASDGLRLSRRLQRQGALLSLAATQGYMQAYADALRDRFRHLRHDLRNPLGTIKSVLALMDDDSVPLDARVNPSFRAMATRNARSLEELIAERLSDAAALLPTVAGQSVSVRAIACAVRRELRAEAEKRGVVITVEQGGSHGHLDAAGLELLLRDALHSTLQESEAGEHIHVDFDQASGRASVVLSCESGRTLIRDTRVLERLSTLAGQVGATFTTGEAVRLSIQVRLGEGSPARERERSVPREPGDLGDGETGHDVRGAHESHHGQSGVH
jgi:signal transduction histidine kinase